MNVLRAVPLCRWIAGLVYVAAAALATWLT